MNFEQRINMPYEDLMRKYILCIAYFSISSHQLIIQFRRIFSAVALLNDKFSPHRPPSEVRPRISGQCYNVRRPSYVEGSTDFNRIRVLPLIREIYGLKIGELPKRLSRLEDEQAKPRRWQSPPPALEKYLPDLSGAILCQDGVNVLVALWLHRGDRVGSLAP